MSSSWTVPNTSLPPCTEPWRRNQLWHGSVSQGSRNYAGQLSDWLETFIIFILTYFLKSEADALLASCTISVFASFCIILHLFSISKKVFLFCISLLYLLYFQSCICTSISIWWSLRQVFSKSALGAYLSQHERCEKSLPFWSWGEDRRLILDQETACIFLLCL